MFELDWNGPLVADGFLKTIITLEDGEVNYRTYPVRYLLLRERLSVGELEAEKMHLTFTFLLPPESPIAEGSLLVDCHGTEYAIAAFSALRDLNGHCIAILCRVV